MQCVLVMGELTALERVVVVNEAVMTMEVVALLQLTAVEVVKEARLAGIQ